MKKAAEFVKDIINMLAGLAKDTTKELKRKTRAFKTRLVIFSLLHNNNMVVSSWSHKLKAKPTSRNLDDGSKDKKNMVVVYSHNPMSSTPAASPQYVQYVDEDDEDEKYPEGSS